MPSINLRNLSDFIEDSKLKICPHCDYCDKVSFESESSARKEAADFVDQGKGHSWAYECPKGKGWHLTTTKPDHASAAARIPKQPKKKETRRTRRDVRMNRRSK